MVCILLFSCTAKDARDSQLEYFRCSNAEGKPLEETPEYETPEIIKLQTCPQALLRGIKQVEMTDSLIFVLSINGLYQFSRSGEFLTCIGSKGQGPAEYMRLNTFFLDEERRLVGVIDESKLKILYYHWNGQFDSAIDMKEDKILRNSNQAIPFNNGKLLLFYMMCADNMSDNMEYSVYDMNKGELDYKAFSYDPIQLKEYLYPFSMHPMTKIGQDAHLLLPMCDTIYRYSTADNRIEADYLIESPSKKATKEMIKTQDYSMEVFKLNSQGYFTGFNGIFETDNHLLLTVKSEGAIMGYYLFDKRTKTGSHYRYVSAEDRIPFYYTIGAYRDCFIGMAEPHNLIQKDGASICPSLKQLMDTAHEEDNPYLFLYRMK